MVYTSLCLFDTPDIVVLEDFFDRWLMLTRKVLNHGFLLVKFKPSLRNNCYRYRRDLIDPYRIDDLSTGLQLE